MAASRKRLTDDEVIQELDRQANEKQIKVDRARCVLAINRHDASVLPVKRVLTSLGLLDIASAETGPKSIKQQKHEARMVAMQGARIKENGSVADGDIAARFRTLADFTVPMLHERLVILNSTVLSLGNLRGMAKKCVEGSHVANIRLIEFLTGCKGTLAMEGQLSNYSGVDEFLVKRAKLRANRMPLVSLPMYYTTNGLFAVEWIASKVMLIITFRPSGIKSKYALDVNAASVPHGLDENTIFKIDQNWSELGATIKASCDVDWQWACSAVMPQVAMGIVEKTLPALRDGSATSPAGKRYRKAPITPINDHLLALTDEPNAQESKNDAASSSGLSALRRTTSTASSLGSMPEDSQEPTSDALLAAQVVDEAEMLPPPPERAEGPSYPFVDTKDLELKDTGADNLTEKCGEKAEATTEAET